MAIPALTRAQLDKALQEVGVRQGDGLLIHSALQLLGRPERGLQMVLDALQSAVGPHGTLAVPAFAFTFHLGEDFDVANTPSKGMGVFSEFVRKQSAARRTRHPMQSLAVIGAQAEDLAGRETLSAFDDGSAFDRMLAMDFKLLLLGASIQAASIVHYSEQRAAVPYRYWKDLTGRVKLADEWQTRTYRMFVRDLELDPQLKLAPVQKILEAEGQWTSSKLNFGEIACCTLRDFVAAADTLLAADPWALVANKSERVAKQ